MNRLKRITLEPGKRGGKPCIRGLRITVYDVLEYLASGMTEAEILADFPDLEREDIRAVLTFAAERERRLVSIHPGEAPLRREPVPASCRRAIGHLSGLRPCSGCRAVPIERCCDLGLRSGPRPHHRLKGRGLPSS